MADAPASASASIDQKSIRRLMDDAGKRRILELPAFQEQAQAQERDQGQEQEQAE